MLTRLCGIWAVTVHWLIHFPLSMAKGRGLPLKSPSKKKGGMTEEICARRHILLPSNCYHSCYPYLLSLTSSKVGDNFSSQFTCQTFFLGTTSYYSKRRSSYSIGGWSPNSKLVTLLADFVKKNPQSLYPRTDFVLSWICFTYSF